MLAALLQEELGNVAQVESAGISKKAGEGLPANVHTDQLMRHRGFDLSSHKSRRFDSLDLAQFSHIVCVDETTEEEVILSLVGCWMIEILVANEGGGGIPLTPEAGWQEHRACLALLERTIPAIARQIRG